MDENIRYNGPKLAMGDESVVLPGEIKEVVKTKENIVVLFTPAEDDSNNSNVWAFDDKLGRKWIIEQATLPTGESHRYTGIWVEDNDLWAYNWNGGRYKIDHESGTILESRMMK